jgi:hypothetical protein
MIQIPADLGQRISDAVRIAAAMHEQEQGEAHAGRDAIAYAGGAGRGVVVMDHDGTSIPRDGSSPASRLRRRWSRLR